MTPKTSPATTGAIIGAVILVIMLLQGVKVIGAGERGVIFNAVTGMSPRILVEGMHLVIPFIEQITRYNVRVQTYTMTRSTNEGKCDYVTVDDSLWAPTREGLKVGIDLSVRYHPDPMKIDALHQRIGPDYEEKIVRPQVRSVTRMAISGYDIMDVYSSKGRMEIQLYVENQLKKLFSENYLICDELLIRDVFFTPDFEKSVENKKSAEQHRQQALIDAESARIEAQGKADALMIVNKAIAQNPKLLAYKWIEKLGDQVKVLVVPQGTGTILDPSKY
jgi:regulator of protease activity HflC (stomatin/prohibitin superfamily)